MASQKHYLRPSGNRFENVSRHLQGNEDKTVDTWWQQGAAPRVRGKPLRNTAEGNRPRSIPAYTGKTRHQGGLR